MGIALLDRLKKATDNLLRCRKSYELLAQSELEDNVAAMKAVRDCLEKARQRLLELLDEAKQRQGCALPGPIARAGLSEGVYDVARSLSPVLVRIIEGKA
jgi:hypothetical protein